MFRVSTFGVSRSVFRGSEFRSSGFEVFEVSGLVFWFSLSGFGVFGGFALGVRGFPGSGFSRFGVSRFGLRGFQGFTFGVQGFAFGVSGFRSSGFGGRGFGFDVSWLSVSVSGFRVRG